MVADEELQGSARSVWTANTFRKDKLWSTAKKTFVGNASWSKLDEGEIGQGVEAGAASGRVLRLSQFKIHKGKSRLKQIFQ